MDKTADHLRKVPMPGRWKPPKSVMSDNTTDFGFGDKKKKKQQEQSTSAAPGSLDDAYEFWKKNQSPANMDRLLRAASPAINKALSSFAAGDKALTARAKRLAIDAFRTFDPKKGAKLGTHLYIRLQPLQREYTQRSTISEVPERVQLDKFRLEQAERALTDELGREPADEEVAEYTGLSPKRIAHVRSFARKSFAESQLASTEGELVQPAVADVTPEDIWIEYVYHDLDPVDKKILEWKTGMYGKKVLSTNEIARRLKITPSAVSQRASKIALRLENVRG